MTTTVLVVDDNEAMHIVSIDNAMKRLRALEEIPAIILSSGFCAEKIKKSVAVGAKVGMSKLLQPAQMAASISQLAHYP